MVDGELQDTALFPMRVGERLRVARESAGFSLDDVGTRTRIPIRHLEAIERSDYAALPSSTYAVGFTKSYARAVGLDENGIATDVRAELGRGEPGARDTATYDLADPARVPSRLLAWTAAAIAVLLAVGYGLWRAQMFASDTTFSVTAAAPRPRAPAPAAPSANTAAAAPRGPGQVVLTATAPVWLRITDAANKKLVEKEMAAGESFTLPTDAAGPRILTGRPEALKVAIDGREVAALGPPERTIADMPIDAASLIARPSVNGPAAVNGVAPVTR